MVIINDYHVDKKLSLLWIRNSLKEMRNRNSDKVYIVDGIERIGKSLWTIQQACVIEPSLLESPEKLISRIAFSPEEFHQLCRNVKNGIIIFDEAFRGLSVRAAMSKTNKVIIQTLMEMGQNNNIVFIVLPSFFMLDIYPAMLRSVGLFNIYQNRKNKRRCFRGWNRWDKNKMYQIGTKKGWGYLIRTNFKGYFFPKFPGGAKFEKAYLKKKADALATMIYNETSPVKGDENAYSYLNDFIKMRKEGKTFKEIGTKYGYSLETVRRVLRKAIRSTLIPTI